MAKLTKFKTIQERMDILAEEYKIAKENEDIEKMSVLQEEYENTQVLLYSNVRAFQKMDSKDLKFMINSVEDEDKKNQFKAKLQQKKIYADNNSYVKMVSKSSTLDEYIESKDNKKRKLVKRTFKKVLVGAGLIALASSLVMCGKNKKGKNKINDTKDDKYVVEQVQGSNEKDKNNEKDRIDNQSSIDINTQKTNVNNNDDILNNIDRLIPSIETIIEEKQLDPEIPTETPSVPTGDVVVSEPSIPESDPIVYPGSTDVNINEDIPSTPESDPVPYPGIVEDDNKHEVVEDDTIQNPADAAGDNIDDENDEIKNPADAAGDNIDDENFPVIDELPKKEIETIIEIEEHPKESPADAAGDIIEETIVINTTSTPKEDKKEETISQNPADAAGDIIDETIYEDTNIIIYENPDVVFYENESALNIEGEIYTLSLK